MTHGLGMLKCKHHDERDTFLVLRLLRFHQILLDDLSTPYSYTDHKSMIMQVTPMVTFCVVLLAIAPCLIKAWRDPHPKMIVRWIGYAYTCGFMFGWHVHEKASLHFVIPLAIIALKSVEDATHYFYLSIGIFPSLSLPSKLDISKPSGWPDLYYSVISFTRYLNLVRVHTYILLYSFVMLLFAFTIRL